MRRYAGFLTALLLLLPACGGSDEHLTKAEFVKQGNAICKKGNDAIDAAIEEKFGDNEPEQKELEAFATDTLVPNVQNQIDDVRALKEPKDDEDEVNAMLDDAEKALDTIAKDPSVLTGDEDPFATVNKQLTAYGLTVCGNDEE